MSVCSSRPKASAFYVRIARLFTLLLLVGFGGAFGQAQAAGIALVQHIGKDAGTTTTSALAFSGANTVGNFIAVVIRGGLSNSQVFTVKDSLGNTYKQAVQLGSSGSAVTSAIYYAENINAGANTITVTMTVSGPLRFDILEYSGVATSNSLDVTASATATSTSPNSGSATTTGSGELLLGEVAIADTSAFTAGPGYTIRDFIPVEPNTKLIVEDQIQAAAGTASASASMNPSSNWAALLAVFKPAGGVAPPSVASLSPTSGPVGTSVTITGSNFGAAQGTSTVSFNGVAATPTSWSASSIVVPVPSGATSGNVVVSVGSIASNPAAFTVTVPPSITSLSPTSGAVGIAITITGTNFGASQGTSTVTFNGTAATPSSWSASSIVVPVPTGATSGNVVVAVAGLSSNGALFTVVVPPSITSLSPTSGPVGTSVTIAGANFGSSQGTSTVTFNGTAATPTSWSATSVVVPVPSGATTGNVVVAVAGLASNGAAFTVIVPPSITSLSPTSGPIGTSVTITGTNFGSTQGTSTVTFNGTAATPTSWSATSIVVPVPSGATFGNVTVTVGGLASNSVPFTVLVPPSISSLSPTSGAVGTSVTITGANFGTSQGTSTVTFNGTAATPTSWNSTTIVVPVPTGATTGSVVVTASGLASNGVAFTVIATPNITSLSPASGPVGTSVTITGTNFGAAQNTSTVTFNGLGANPTSWSDTSIVVTVPNGAVTGNVLVTVVGFPSNGVLFTVTIPPSITSLSPTSAPVGASVTITGANFGASQGTSTVTFNGTTATPTSWSATSIVVPVPTGATTGNVVITVGGVASNGVNFGVTPSITSLNPTSGAPGTSVAISGGDFGATQGTSTVTFNGVTATPSSWSHFTIFVPVPTGATTGNVVLTVSGVASNGVAFTVPPTITSLSPTSAPVGNAVTITGTNFGASQGTSTVTFNGSAAAPTNWSATSISVLVPNGAMSGNVIVTVGGVASNAVAFAVLPTPNITSITPAGAQVGALVTISGTNFGASQGSSTVTFNLTRATPTSWSPTSITVPVPSGASTGNVVIAANGVLSNAVPFTVAPAITNVTPPSGTVGDSISIPGTNFGAFVTGDTVTFNGTPATIQSWIDTGATVLVPSGATTGPLVVTVGGFASNSFNFTVTPVTITALNPNSGSAGTSVTITGTNFGSTQGSSAVAFPGTGATTPTSWSQTTIVVPVPAGAITGNVTVMVGGVTSNAVPFTVTSPSISSLSPNNGAVGSSVTISGANFGASQSTSTVTFNGLAATPTSWSPTSIAVTVPVGATTGNVVVTVGGMASNGMNFVVNVVPKITSLTPSSGPIGTSVTVSGSNFGATQGSSSVTFGGILDTPSSWSDTSLVVTIPNLSAGSAGIQVTVGGFTSSPAVFQVTPGISSLSPTSGPVGASVTITGSDFGGTQGTSTVTFNGVPATPTSWTFTSIVVPVPAGATTGNVVVTVAGEASNGVPFTVSAPQANIALVQHIGRDAGTTTTTTLAFNSANTAGNFIAVAIRGGLSNAQVFTVKDSNSNTYMQAKQIGSSGSAVTSAIYYAENIKPGANTITVTMTVSGPLRIDILEYSGVATSNSLDATAAATTTSTSPNSGNLTTTANGDLLLGMVATADSDAFTSGSGYTARDFVPVEPNTKLVTEDQIQSTAGTASAPATLSVSSNWGAILAAFKAAGGTGGGAGIPASITATAGTPQSATVGMAFASQLQATVKDSLNNPVSGVTVTFMVPVSGPSGGFAGGVTTAVTNASGVATSAVFTGNTTSGSYTVTASVSGVPIPANFSLTNLASSATNIIVAGGTPQSAPVNTAFASQLQASVRDAFNNPVSGVTVTFTVPASGASGAFAGGVNTATTNAQGIATAPVLTANATAGSFTVIASAPGVTPAASYSLTNLSGPPASVTATGGTPQSATVNTAFSMALQVTVKDASNNPLSNVTVTFTVPGSGASGTFAFGVNSVLTNSSGIASTNIFTANAVAGTYTVTASVAGVATPASFSMTNLAGAASSISATAGTPQSATINMAFATQLQATVKDSFNNPVNGVTVTFTAPASGASGTFASGVNTATTNSSGIATSAVFTANGTTGSYTVIASATGVASSVNFSLTNVSAPPASITATGGTPQSATVNSAFTTAFQVTVKDASNNPVSGATVTFTAPGSGASGTFAGGVNTATTNSSGIATSAVFTANAVAGTYTLTASVAGVGTSANFSLTNLAGSAANIAATSGTPQNAVVNTAFAAQLQATVTDSLNNPVSGVTVTFAAPGSGASGTFAGGVNSATTNAQGVATAPVFTANATAGGPYTVSASATGVATQVSFSLTNLSAVSNITLVQHRNIDASTQTNNSLAFANNTIAGNFIAVAIRGSASSSQVFTVTDSSGNTYHQAFSLGLSASAETFAIFYAENIHGGADKISVTQSVLGTLRFAILEYSGVATSNSLDGTATAQGSSASPNSGNLTTTANGDLLLATIITKSSGTYTAAGSYNIEETIQPAPNTKIVTEDQLQSAAGSVSAGVSLAASDVWGAGLAAFRSTSGAVAPISVSVSPNSASVPAGYGTQAFADTVTNDFLNRGATWSLSGAGCSGSTCGTLSRVTTTSVLYTAPSSIPSPATVTLTATSIGDGTKSASAAITVTQGVLTVVVSPKRAAVTLSSSPVQFAGNVYNDAQNLGVTWQVDGNNGGTAASGTISATGLYTPGTQPGQHTITAVSNANASVSGSALMAITDLAGVYTNHNDNARTGQNLKEYGLTTTTVTPSTFGLLYSCPVDGYVYAQPLWAANLNFSGVMHNVVFIATEHDSVYAFDADSPTCMQLWQTNFLSSGVTTLTMADVNSNTDIIPEIGITSTPVIDPATNTLYVVPKTRETVGTVNGQACSSASPCYVHRLHALDLITGAEKFSGPVVISAANFSAQKHLQRPALLLANSTLYLAFGSHGDQCNYQGWLMGYNAATLAQTFATAVSNPSVCNQGAIWQSGGGPSADASGNVYVVTANGLYDGSSNFGDTVLKFNSTGSMPPADWFTPFNQATLAANDVDLGAAAVLILPDAVGSAAHPHLAITTGKDAVVYLLDQTSMGKFNSSSNNDVQELVPVPPANTTMDDGGNYVGPAYWNGNIYLTGQNYPLMQFQISNGVIATPQFASSSNTFPPRGGAPVVSANGATGGIVWIIDYSGFQDNTPAILDAYDANNVGTLLFSSPASGSGAAGNGVKFTPPTVANSKVYVGGQFVFTVYGLLPN